MREKPYYSIRTGKNPKTRYQLPLLRRLLFEVHADFERRCFFQEAFGYYCIDIGDVSGNLGTDIEAYLLRKLRKSGLWPISERYERYSEDDAFDLIEFLYDHVSTPVSGYDHSYSGHNCGWHYSEFGREEGRKEFRAAINEILPDYEGGFELVESGEVCIRVPDDMRPLFEASIPELDLTNVTARVQAAKTKFTLRGVSSDDKRDAVRDLADVLEYLRPRISSVLTSKDESDLFILANNFGIRHHNDRQKTGYEREVWYEWMFYYYLNTIVSALRLLDVVMAEDIPFA